MGFKKLIDKDAISDFIEDLGDEYDEHLDFLSIFLKKNKIIIIIGIIIFTIGINIGISKMPEKFIDIFDSLFFKIIVFGIITFIFSENITIAITLALAILITYQFIANRKIILELEKEDYIPLKGYFKPDNNTLNFTSLKTVYQEMINDGIDKVKNKEIHEGEVLIASGINLSQKSDQGQLDFIDQLQDENAISFSNTKKIIDLYKKYNKYPDVIVKFNNIENIIKELSKPNLSYKEYNQLVTEKNKSELNFLETIIRYKKNITPTNISTSNKIIKDLKSPSEKKNKHWIEKIGLLGDLLL